MDKPDFDLQRQTRSAKMFLRDYIEVAKELYEVESLQLKYVQILAEYIAELALLCNLSDHFSPNVIAGSTIFLTNFILNPEVHPWGLSLVNASNLMAFDLRECVFVLKDIFTCPSGYNLEDVIRQYNAYMISKGFICLLSDFDCPSIIKDCFFYLLIENPHETHIKDSWSDWFFAVLDTTIFDNLRKIEMELKPTFGYMEEFQGNEITPEMRMALIDWLAVMLNKFDIPSATLHLCVYFIDRFLSIKAHSRTDFKLLGVSSFFIAMKIEEGTTHLIHKLCEMTKFSLKVQEVLAMEMKILDALHYELYCPNTLSFLSHCVKFVEDSNQAIGPSFRSMTYYLADLTLVEFDFIKFPYSLIASEVVFLSKFTLSPTINPWDLSLANYTNYKALDLQECITIVLDLLLGNRGGKFLQIREKYKQIEFQCVSRFPIPKEIPMEYFKEIADLQ